MALDMVVTMDGLKLNETCHNKNSHGFKRAIVLVKEANTRLCGECLALCMANVKRGTIYTLEVLGVE